MKGGWIILLIAGPLLVIGIAALLIVRMAQPSGELPAPPKQLAISQPTRSSVPATKATEQQQPKRDSRDAEIERLRMQIHKMQSEPAPATQPEISEDAFKPFAQRLPRRMEIARKEDREQSEKEHPPLSKSDEISKQSYSLVSIDVVRTDSLLHPVAAVATIHDEYTSDNNRGFHFYFAATVKLSFVLKDGRWEMIKATEHIDTIYPSSEFEHPKKGDENDLMRVDWLRVAVERANDQ